jgi:hypothetical protein
MVGWKPDALDSPIRIEAGHGLEAGGLEFTEEGDPYISV